MTPPLHVVLIDNFDSFTFNLVDEFAQRGATVEVWRNTIPSERALARAAAVDGPRLVVLSPGPGAPRDAGCCVDLIRQAGPRVPVFGVCLGHQAMIEAWGGVVESAGAILHGRSSRVMHNGASLFAGIPSPVTVGRYHSLASHAVPTSLEALAWSDRIVMAVRHRTLPQVGIQFHPESILTPHGGQMIEQVIRWAEGGR
jgi:anthranilate synthase component 2